MLQRPQTFDFSRSSMSASKQRRKNRKVFWWVECVSFPFITGHYYYSCFDYIFRVIDRSLSIAICYTGGAGFLYLILCRNSRTKGNVNSKKKKKKWVFTTPIFIPFRGSFKTLLGMRAVSNNRSVCRNRILSNMSWNKDVYRVPNSAAKLINMDGNANCD